MTSFHVCGIENKSVHLNDKRRFFLPSFEVRILTKTLKPIQMSQLGVGQSQMHPPLYFFFPASVISFVYNKETGCGFTNVRRYKAGKFLA